MVVVTIAPKYLAIWIANVPSPPEPAWIKTLSPFLISPFVINACHAVSPASGTEAASIWLIFFGLIASSSSWTRANSAIEPASS